jgi:hypothetical protein
MDPKPGSMRSGVPGDRNLGSYCSGPFLLAIASCFFVIGCPWDPQLVDASGQRWSLPAP